MTAVGQPSRLAQTGRFSVLRYPGGKGKVARFVSNLVKANSLSDGTYVEPYAGGAAVAWELLLTGIVRKIEINDISRPIFAFWNLVLTDADRLCARISDTRVTIETWKWAKSVFASEEGADLFDLGFAMFYLNRTNRSGILNGGVIGGLDQKGQWKIDTRYNKGELIARIQRIATMASRVSLTNLDAIVFLETRRTSWNEKTLVYLDPPYFQKGGELYYDAYRHSDHAHVAAAVFALQGPRWMVSYDDVPQIHRLYSELPTLRYSIGYSARKFGIGSEAMFFSPGLKVPAVQGSMVEIERRLAIS